MVVIDLITRIVEISPILAVRSLSTLEHPFESDSGLRVVQAGEDASCRLLYLPDQDAPVLRAETVGDIVNWRRLNDIDLPEDLRLALAAIGTRAGHNTLDLEAFDDRVSGIDMAWCLARRVRNAGVEEPTELVAKVLALAAAWQRNRGLIFDASSPSSNLLRERERLVAQTRELVAACPGKVEEVILYDEPRGSALAVAFSDGREPFGVSGAVTDWKVDANFGRSESTASRIQFGTGPYAVKPTKLDEAVAGAIATALFDGKEVRLVKQLTPRVYAKVSELFLDLGATWAASRQAHVFKAPAREVLATAIQWGVIFTRRDFEFFETQPRECERVVREAQLGCGMLVLEPSAGRGALALAAAAVVGMGNVTCHELMPENIAVLETLGFAVAEHGDFLSVQPTPIFDRVLLNPPFSSGRDVAHVQHALQFLKPGGRVVAIMSNTWRNGTSKAQRAFATLIADHAGRVQEIEGGAFAAVGTDVASCLLTLDVPLAKVVADAAAPTHPVQKAANTDQLALFA